MLHLIIIKLIEFGLAFREPSSVPSPLQSRNATLTPRLAITCAFTLRPLILYNRRVSRLLLIYQMLPAQPHHAQCNSVPGQGQSRSGNPRFREILAFLLQGRPLKAKSFAVVSLIGLSHVAYDILWSLIRFFFGVFLLSVSYISGNTVTSSLLSIPYQVPTTHFTSKLYH